MKNRIVGLHKALLVIGVCLIVGAAIVVIATIHRINTSETRMSSYVREIRTAIPDTQGAALEKSADVVMPALSVEGDDFIGVLEIPKYAAVFPVCGEWGNTIKYPCRLSGSVYDKSIKIGGTTQKGQYDFYRDISVGDEVYFTDMRGNRYGYAIEDIRYEKHADQTTLNSIDAALVIFIKNIFAFEYVVIFCDTLR